MKKFFNNIGNCIKNIMAPFLVTKYFIYFSLWIMIIIVTLMGPIFDALKQPDNRIEYFIESGTLYYSVITLLFSYAVTNGIDVLFERKHDNGPLPFLHYQIITLLVAFLYNTVLIFLYISYRSNMTLQLVLSIVGYIFSFYLYGVACMPRVAKEMDNYALPYFKQIQNGAADLGNSNPQKTPDGAKL